jgi:hypothetical protein
MVKRIVVESRSGRKRSLGVELSDEKLTSHGGLAPVKAFMDKLGVRRLLDERLGHQDGLRYTAAEILELLIASKAVGDTRLSHMERFAHDETVRFLFDLPSVPVATTVARLLERLDEDDVHRLEDAHADLVREHLLKGRRSITVDIDSTPLPVWGSQEGTAKGYCPSRRGARTYHPNLAFDAKTGMALQGELRPGNRSSIGPQGEIESFLDRLFDRVIPHIEKVRARMDSGYFGDRTLTWLEARGVQYTISARGVIFPEDLSDRITWSPARKGIRYGEFTFRFKKWKLERRFVVRRDQRKPSQRRLDGIADTDIVVVTNLAGRPKNVIDFYNARGTAEQFIAEGKQEWGLGDFVSRKLLPNRVDFCLTLLAMNLVIGYRERVLPISLRRHRPGTIRRLFINVAARLVRRSRQVRLRFGKALRHRDAWAIVLYRLGRSPPVRLAQR